MYCACTTKHDTRRELRITRSQGTTYSVAAASAAAATSGVVIALASGYSIERHTKHPAVQSPQPKTINWWDTAVPRVRSQSTKSCMRLAV